MELNDYETIIDLKKKAPYTYMCCSTWYNIAAKYGCGLNETDAHRNWIMENLLKENSLNGAK